MRDTEQDKVNERAISIEDAIFLLFRYFIQLFPSLTIQQHDAGRESVERAEQKYLQPLQATMCRRRH